MVVTCDNCGAKYNVDEDKIKGRGARITCKKCSHVFAVYLKEPEPAVEEEQEDIGEQMIDDLDVNTLDFKSVGITSWKVKVKIGLVYDFSDYKTLSKYIREGKVANTDLLSHDGKDWKAIDQIDDLKRHFCATYLMAKNKMSSTESEEESTEQKKAKTLSGGEGLSDLASVIAEAEAEVQGRDPAANPYAAKTTTKRKRPPKAAESKPTNILPFLGIAALLMIGFVVWKILPGEDQPVPDEPVAQKKAPSKPSSELAAFNEQVKKEAGKITAKEEEEEEKARQKEQEKVVIKTARRPNESTVQTSSEPPPQQTESPIVEATNALNAGKWSKAIKHYKKLSPKNQKETAEKHRGMGIALFQIAKKADNGEFEAARSQLEKANRMEKLLRTPDALKYLGYISDEEGDEAERNRLFKQYLTKNPKDAARIRKKMRN